MKAGGAGAPGQRDATSATAWSHSARNSSTCSEQERGREQTSKGTGPPGLARAELGSRRLQAGTPPAPAAPRAEQAQARAHSLAVRLHERARALAAAVPHHVAAVDGDARLRQAGKDYRWGGMGREARVLWVACHGHSMPCSTAVVRRQRQPPPGVHTLRGRRAEGGTGGGGGGACGRARVTLLPG